jgi:hypothetical protein
MRAILVLASGAALVACGNTYHPEYHPVTVTSYEQHAVYPPTAQANARTAPVFVAPAPPAPPTPAPWSAWPNE